MYRACVLAIFLVLIHAQIGGERVIIEFCNKQGNVVETKDYNVHRVIFELSGYMDEEAERYQCSVSEHKQYNGQIVIRLVCDLRTFDIVADLLDDRALNTTIQAADIVDALELAERLKFKDDKIRLYVNLALAVVNSRELRGELMVQNDVPDIKLFVLQLMRVNFKEHGVDVRVRGNRATVCPHDEKQCPEHGLSDRISVVDEMRIWDSAMETLLACDREFVDALIFYIRKMEIRALELDHCMLGEGIIRCIASMGCLTRLSMRELSNDVIKGLSSFVALKDLTELDISGNRMNNKRLRKIGALKSLKKLSIENCGLGAGSCWGLCSADLRCIEGLENLTELNVGRNRLKESDMRVIGEMKCLKELKIGHCNMKAGSIRHIKGLEKLKMLDISENRLSKKDLMAVGDIKSLLRLKMSKCVWKSCMSMFACNSASLEYLQDLSNLIELDVSNTNLSKMDMVGIGKLPSLVKIDMLLCRIKPKSLCNLGSLDKLKEMNIFEVRKLSKEDKKFIQIMKERGVLVKNDAGR